MSETINKARALLAGLKGLPWTPHQSEFGDWRVKDGDGHVVARVYGGDKAERANLFAAALDLVQGLADECEGLMAGIKEGARNTHAQNQMLWRRISRAESESINLKIKNGRLEKVGAAALQAALDRVEQAEAERDAALAAAHDTTRMADQLTAELERQRDAAIARAERAEAVLARVGTECDRLAEMSRGAAFALDWEEAERLGAIGKAVDVIRKAMNETEAGDESTD